MLSKLKKKSVIKYFIFEPLKDFVLRKHYPLKYNAKT